MAPLDETFKHMLDQGGAVERGRYWAYSEHEQDHFEEPSWLVKDLVPDHGLVMLYGPGGSYKSFIALDVALTLASCSSLQVNEAKDPNAKPVAILEARIVELEEINAAQYAEMVGWRTQLEAALARLNELEAERVHVG